MTAKMLNNPVATAQESSKFAMVVSSSGDSVYVGMALLWGQWTGRRSYTRFSDPTKGRGNSYTACYLVVGIGGIITHVHHADQNSVGGIFAMQRGLAVHASGLSEGH